MNNYHPLQRCFLRLLLTVSVAASASLVRAQVVIGPPRISQIPLPTSTTISPAPTGLPGSLATIGSALARQGPLVTWKGIAVRPSTSYSVQYGDGILRVPGEPVNTTMHTFTQGLLFDIGKTWTLNAAYSHSSSSSRLIEDTDDSSIHLAGAWTHDDWSFGLTQVYTSNSPIVVETGGQNAERNTRTSGNIGYKLGDRTSLDTTATWSRRLASPEFRSATWIGSDWEQLSLTFWANYDFTQKTSFSLGASAGQDDVKLSSDMNYIQPQARFRWNPTQRLTLSVGGGMEYRRVEGIAGKRFENPVYDVNLSYSPTLTTAISIGASQSISNSYFNEQTTRGTGSTANISQRLLQRFFLSAGVARGTSEYAATTHLFTTDRKDKFQSFNVGLSTSLWRRGSISLTYTRDRNLSNTADFEYSSHTIGANISYAF